MPNQREGCKRVEIQVPPALLDAIDREAGGEPRNVWILRALAKVTGVKLSPEQIAPRRGPRGKTPPPPARRQTRGKQT